MGDDSLTLTIFQSIVGSLGICGNGLVCLVIAKVPFMHTLTNAFIFNQALIDLFGSLLIVLTSLVPIPDPLPSGTSGVLLCRLWVSGYFNWALFVSSTFNLVALTLERYLAIVFPFRYRALGTRKNAIVTILAVWLSAFMFTSYGVFIRYHEAGQCRQKLVAHPEALGVAVFVVTYLLPVTIMLVVYVRIAVVLKKGAARIQPGPEAAGPSTGQAPEGPGESLMRARRNTFKTLLIVCVAFTVCWTPNEVAFLLFNLGVAVDLTSPLFFVTVAMVSTNSCLNPVIYAMKYKQFRKAMTKFFGRKDTTGENSTVATVSIGTYQ
ncbi:galanin receptor type 2-like [Patiria miniata]|uniref:G-protein coupled receptors family 1 profile domain-containing protein n=1 Tax=Patiria miniata TaxID=46514 RepID=A0A913ZGD1_PATMI|nr:galanin receptor type 2-like [Patiria miniata]